MSADLFSEAKSAGSSELRLKLGRSEVEYLRGAVQNPHFGDEHLEAILSNPALPAALIQGIASHKLWLSRYEVKRGIVFHRNTARTLKLNLMHFLGWRDLARVVEDALQTPAVKRAAESLLRNRIEEMAVGEKIALSRIAAPAIIPSLRSDLHPDVIAALLTNPRVTMEDVVAVCVEERAAPAALSAVGSSPRWGERHPIRMALLRNPATPAKVCLRFLDSLSGEDLKEIIALPTTPRLVRVTARQILKARNGTVDTKKVVS
ncbi:MAG TPA: hypothetical protein VFW45_14300 [Candidatus Polarisedimenticolia bacterium]|nr:hypothetical protein [Candidatus Polarisedimenticolia bacterium]